MSLEKLQELLYSKHRQFEEEARRAARKLSLSSVISAMRFEPGKYAFSNNDPPTIEMRIERTDLSATLTSEALSLSGLGISLKTWKGKRVQEIYREALGTIREYEDKHPLPF